MGCAEFQQLCMCCMLLAWVGSATGEDCGSCSFLKLWHILKISSYCRVWSWHMTTKRCFLALIQNQRWSSGRRSSVLLCWKLICSLGIEESSLKCWNPWFWIRRQDRIVSWRFSLGCEWGGVQGNFFFFFLLGFQWSEGDVWSPHQQSSQETDSESICKWLAIK